MRSRRAGRTVAVMLPALRLPLRHWPCCSYPRPAAQAAKGLSVPVPAEGQVAVAVAGGVKSVKVKSAPAGVTVAGGVKKGRLAVAVVRPRGVAASGKVVLTLRGKAKQRQDVRRPRWTAARRRAAPTSARCSASA